MSRGTTRPLCPHPSAPRRGRAPGSRRRRQLSSRPATARTRRRRARAETPGTGSASRAQTRRHFVYQLLRRFVCCVYSQGGPLQPVRSRIAFKHTRPAPANRGRTEPARLFSRTVFVNKDTGAVINETSRTLTHCSARRNNDRQNTP